MNYRAVFHVDQKDGQVWQLALNNVTNLLSAIPGQDHDLVVLLNGPAVSLMAEEEAAPFAEQVRGLAARGVRFLVCENALQRFGVSRECLLAQCQVIPAGIVGLIDLQGQGFAYIKP